MFKNKFFLGLIIVTTLGVIGYTFLGNETTVSTDEYAAQIEQERRDKDNFFKNSEQSPVQKKADFKGLNYFAPNASFKVVADVLPYDSTDKKVAISMTDGSTETYEKYGYAEFRLDNTTPQRLLIYKHEGGLSMLFRDATTPTETYGGGRYLDFAESDIKDGKIVIDFNKAYNPYCAYNYTFACPLPPKENTLTIRIEAGEKKFE